MLREIRPVQRPPGPRIRSRVSPGLKPPRHGLGGEVRRKDHILHRDAFAEARQEPRCNRRSGSQSRRRAARPPGGTAAAATPSASASSGAAAAGRARRRSTAASNSPSCCQRASSGKPLPARLANRPRSPCAARNLQAWPEAALSDDAKPRAQLKERVGGASGNTSGNGSRLELQQRLDLDAAVGSAPPGVASGARAARRVGPTYGAQRLGRHHTRRKTAWRCWSARHASTSRQATSGLTGRHDHQRPWRRGPTVGPPTTPPPTRRPAAAWREHAVRRQQARVQARKQARRRTG
jgi:hypothetical protein